MPAKLNHITAQSTLKSQRPSLSFSNFRYPIFLHGFCAIGKIENFGNSIVKDENKINSAIKRAIFGVKVVFFMVL